MADHPEFNTNNVEVAMIAAALHLTVTKLPSGTDEEIFEACLKRFEKAYQVVKSSVDSPASSETIK